MRRTELWRKASSINELIKDEEEEEEADFLKCNGVKNLEESGELFAEVDCDDDSLDDDFAYIGKTDEWSTCVVRRARFDDTLLNFWVSLPLVLALMILLLPLAGIVVNEGASGVIRLPTEAVPFSKDDEAEEE